MTLFIIVKYAFVSHAPPLLWSHSVLPNYTLSVITIENFSIFSLNSFILRPSPVQGVQNINPSVLPIPAPYNPPPLHRWQSYCPSY